MSDDVPDGEITVILQRIQRGEENAAADLLRLVYAQLRKLAAAKMAREGPGITLQPTMLVHDAWFKLAAEREQNWKDRGHFFVAAGRAMQRLLVDAARRRNALRRGGDQEHVELEGLALAAPMKDDRLVALEEALERFAVGEPEKAELVRLRYFAGLTMAEAAETLGITESQGYRWWDFARACLTHEIAKEEKT